MSFSEKVAQVRADFPRMSQEEATDLVRVREAMQREKIDCFSWLCALADAKPDMLRNSGFGGKTNAEAVLAGLQYSRKKIQKFLDDHTRKWPDK